MLRSMGLRLIVMRHAKSSWKSGARTDHARPLNKRGRRDSPRVGAYLHDLGWVPDRIISSDSARTTETFERMAKELGGGRPLAVEFTRDLYHAGTQEVQTALAELGDDVDTAMVLGHNPGWEEVLLWLTGDDLVMKTGCAALLKTKETNWRAAVTDPECWKIHKMVRPRELAD